VPGKARWVWGCRQWGAAAPLLQPMRPKDAGLWQYPGKGQAGTSAAAAEDRRRAG